jgi:tetratricopeptide (TPR) repeat protein
MEAGKLDAAEADFQAVLETPEAPASERQNARYNMGLLQLKRKKPVDAEREFSLVLADNSLHVTAYRGRGIARMEQENFRDGLEDLLKVLKETPKDAIANYNAALCLIASGRRDLAIRYMERALEAAPESEEGRKAKRFLDAESLAGESTPR